jgi:hypothetical protein
MAGLKALDHVAYIRFASIYKDFSDPGDFAEIAERVEKEATPPRPRQIAVSAPQADHRPRPSAARPEHRQGGAGDAQLRADRAAAGRAARRLAQPRCGPGGERRRRRARAGAGLRTRAGSDRRLLATSSPRPCAAATSSCRCSDRGDGGPDRRVGRRSAILFGPSARASRPRKWRSPMRSSPFRSTRVRLAEPRPGGDPARLRMVEARRRSRSRPAKELEPPAPHGELEGLIGSSTRSSTPRAISTRRRARQATKNTLRTIFTKTGWSSREVKAVRGIIRR